MNKWYPVTPTRKRLVKAVTRKSFKAVADSSWSNTNVQPYLKQKFYRYLKKEIKTLQSVSTNSILLHSKPEDIMSFSWGKFEEELKLSAPMLYSVFLHLTTTRSRRPNQSAIICICIAIILKFRYPKMSLIHKLISSVLYSGHCSKQVATCISI